MPTITQVGNSSNSHTSSSIELDEFIPIVRYQSLGDLTLYSTEEAKYTKSDEDVKLSDYLDANKSSYKAILLTTTKDEVEIPFSVAIGKGSESWFQDNDGYIEVELKDSEGNDAKGVSIEGIRKNGEDYKKDKKILVKFGDNFDVKLKFTSKESIAFYIDFKANDDDDTFNNGEYENIHCGRIKVEYKTPNEWQFTQEKIQEIKTYAKANYVKARGPGDDNRYHHCTDTHKHIVYKLLKPVSLNLGKDQNHLPSANRFLPSDYEKVGEATTAGVRNTLKALTYAESSKIFTVIDINGKEVLNNNGTVGNTDVELSQFKESPIEYMKSKCPDNGYYVFIGAYNADYHSFTIIVKKEGDNFTFDFVDQLVGVSQKTEDRLEDRFLSTIRLYKSNFPMQLELYQLRNRKK